MNQARRRVLLAICAAACVAAGPAAAQDAAVAPQRLTIGGSTTMEPLVKELAVNFSRLYPRMQLTVLAGGSGKGIAELRKGAIDVAMVSRVLDEKEADLFGFPIARDGTGLAVHATNPVKNLSRAQVVGIFTGRVRNWKSLGGADRPIVTVTGGLDGGSTDPFLEAFGLKYGELRITAEIASNSERVAALLRDAGAISLLSVGEAERLAESGTPIRLLSIDRVEASRHSILSGDYAMSRPLLLVTRSLPRGAAKAFIDYASSPHATQLIERFEFVPYRE